MQTYPVNFFDWQGVVIRADGHWWIAPRQISDHLGLNWTRQQNKINGSIMREGTALRAIPGTPLRGVAGIGETAIPSMGKMTIQSRQMMTMKLGHFGHWLLGISPLNVPEEKRERLIAMQKHLTDALERQLGQMFGLPLMEVEDFLKLPLPPIALSQMEPADCAAARVATLSNPQAVRAAQMIRIGLPASKVAPLVNHSIYWARQLQRHLRRVGLVPLPPAQQRLLDQPSLFGEA